MTRQALTGYLGGKSHTAQRIIKHFPLHKMYVEPYAGSGAVLFVKHRLPQTYISEHRSFDRGGEVLNDIDSQIVITLRVMRDSPDELADALRLTPYARAEYDSIVNFEFGQRAAHMPHGALPLRASDEVEIARRTIARHHMAFRQGGNGTGFRGRPDDAMTWRKKPQVMRTWSDRLAGVVIECRDALTCIERYDGPETLFYVDPPYLGSARGDCMYAHDMADDESHARLAKTLRSVEGKVVLSGYSSELYDELFHDWRKIDLGEGTASRFGKRTEMLWLSPSCKENGKQTTFEF